MSSPSSVPAPTDALAYLLKHASSRLTALVDDALEPLRIDSKDFGVIRALAHREPTSQLEVARRLGIDRTTMVALLDGLERKGFVTRRPDEGDRRRNVVELTAAGLGVVSEGAIALERAESVFLEKLDRQVADGLRSALRALL